MSSSNTVLIVGTGTIGQPLVSLFSKFRRQFDIDEVIFHKHTPRSSDLSLLQEFQKAGAKLAYDPKKREEFRKMGIEGDYDFESAIEQADVVIDCTPKSNGMKNKTQFYNAHKDDTNLFLAQGSESDFGPIYVHGINDPIISEGKEKFVQVASCNTHAMAIILKTLGQSTGTKSNEKLILKKAEFNLLRRDNDISQKSGFSIAPEITVPKDPIFGTHHAKDINRLFESINEKFPVFSSAIVIPTPFMHTMHFSLELEKPIDKDQLYSNVNSNELIIKTNKTAQNLIFSFGRDFGFQGRILNYAVLVLPSLHILGNTIRGYSFTPQDGNSLISSIQATTTSLSQKSEKEEPNVTDILQDYLFSNI